MRSLILSIPGLAAIAAGALVRSCHSAAALGAHICGPTPLNFSTAAHAHCAGCVLIVAGGVGLLAALAPPALAGAKAIAARVRS